MRNRSISRAIPLAVCLFLATASAAVAAPAVTVEAGAYRDFLAPDPGTSTPGSITFGLNGSAEVIAADAVLTPPADTALAGLGGGVPTCLQVTRDGGAITGLAFVSTCTVAEPVVFVADAFGPGQNAYALSDRVIAPEALIQSNPGMNALFATAADAGAQLALTFTVDTSSGLPNAFAGLVNLGGAITMLGSGGVEVGAATLLAENVDAPERALLQEAADLGVAAAVAVHGAGTLDLGTGDIVVDITLDITFATPPIATPSPTGSPAPMTIPNTGTGSNGQPPVIFFGVVLLATMVMVVAFRGQRLPR
jgi:hypothetical protein